MARTKGARNADYVESRLQLARSVREGLLAEGGLTASLRDLAASAGTSVATLKHYFADRETLVAAVMESMRIDGSPHMARASSPAAGGAEAALRGLLEGVSEAWVRHGVGTMQASMLAQGLASKRLGPVYVSFMLEPLLQVGEQVLQRLVDTRQLARCDVRQASLLLLSPVVLVLLHQENLSGASCRPLDRRAFLDGHLAAFLRAYPPLKPSRPATKGE